MTRRMRVLIAADDDAAVHSARGALEGLALLEVVGQVSDLAQAGREMDTSRPDVVLLDPQLVPTGRRMGEPDPLASLSRSTDIMILSPAAQRLLAVIGTVRRSDGNHRDRYGLSARERDVIEQMCTGADNDAIADALYIAPKTVKNYVGKIFVKLGARSRAEAVAAWLGTRPDGVVTPRPPTEPAGAGASRLGVGE